MAGLDLNVLVARHQFVDFQNTFQMVLAMLRRISSLWNLQDPCIVSGFDMDRTNAIAALASEPPGTFICRFSMNQIGCLVLSCKVCVSSSIENVKTERIAGTRSLVFKSGVCYNIE